MAAHKAIDDYLGQDRDQVEVEIVRFGLIGHDFVEEIANGLDFVEEVLEKDGAQAVDFGCEWESGEGL